AGQLRDSESGLCYNRFRYYDPAGGGYISPDPIGLRGGLNLYAYVKNPLTWIDPLGLTPCKPTTKLPDAEPGQYNYRGIHKGHPEWDNALRGKVVPGNVNSKISAEEHNLGGFSANSPYTSWTDDPNIARRFAGKDGVILRVKTGAPKSGDTWSWEISIDDYFEREILLKGIRSGDVEVFLP
ncbi:RHS repeat-associated core domain-containing protein, partial [Lonsdalea quercina]